METMHAAGRRRLPPVPRPAADRSSGGQLAVTDEQDADQFATQVIDTRLIEAELIEAELAVLAEPADDEPADDEPADDEPADDTAQLTLSELTVLLADESEVESEVDGCGVALPTGPEPTADEQDPDQQFVARLRSAATDFAGAAGADSAVVREAVPPARHRRARCRLVLRFTDCDVVDVTLLGPAGAPGRPSRHGFDRQILRWLGAGLAQDAAWIVEDPDAPDGVAVDLTAWLAAG